MRISGGFSCNAVIWISSLPDSEMGPTNRMVGTMAAHADELKFEFQHVSAKSRSELFMLMDDLVIHASEYGMKPIVHFDAHGSKDEGLYLSGEESFVSWIELSEKLRPVNECTKNNLAVVGAACHGLHAISPISLSVATPFYLLLAPEEKVNVGYFEDNIPGFYRSLFELGSIDVAFSRYLAEKFKYFHCEKMLFIAIARYIAQGCKGKGGAERRERLLTEILSQGMENTAENRKTVRAVLKTGIKPSQSLIDRYAARFLVGRQCGFDIEELLTFVEKCSDS